MPKPPWTEPYEDDWIDVPQLNFGLLEHDMGGERVSGLRQGDVHRVWFIQPLSGHPEFTLMAEFIVTPIGLALAGLQVVPTSRSGWPMPVVTNKILRSISLEGLYRTAQNYILNLPDEWTWAADDFKVNREEFRRTRRPGRRGRDDIHFARIANTYVTLLATSKTPVAELALREDISKSSASSYVHEARRRGLLTQVGQGRAGGRLTSKAKNLLRSEAHVSKKAR